MYEPEFSQVRLRSGKAYQFRYVNHRGEDEIRDAVVDHFLFGNFAYYPEPQWFVHTFDTIKKAPRTFALKDMSEIKEHVG